MGFDSVEFGKFVRHIRMSSGITVQELADKSGVNSAQNITRIEAGTITNPAFYMVHGILKAINDLDLLTKGNVDPETCHPELIELLYTYRKDKARPQNNNANSAAYAMKKFSMSDIEMGLAFMSTMNEHASLKEELDGLWTEICKNFSNPRAVDFSHIIHELTARKQTLFYKQINKGLKAMVTGDSLPQPHKFMILLLRALQMCMDNHGDKQHPEPPKVARRMQRKGDIDF